MMVVGTTTMVAMIRIMKRRPFLTVQVARCLMVLAAWKENRCGKYGILGDGHRPINNKGRCRGGWWALASVLLHPQHKKWDRWIWIHCCTHSKQEVGKMELDPCECTLAHSTHEVKRTMVGPGEHTVAHSTQAVGSMELDPGERTVAHSKQGREERRRRVVRGGRWSAG